MTDWFTDELFEVPGAARVVFPVSRLIVDPERFPDDTLEVMASCGMGVIYQQTSDGLQLRLPPTEEDRQALLRTYYDPHHSALTRAVADRLERCGMALVADCHSFPSMPLPYELDQDTDRPQVCLGTDPYHTPDWLLEAALDALAPLGLSVRVNRPFAGALVPMPHYRRDPRVLALMIEVNRGLYMDEELGVRLHTFAGIRSMLTQVLIGLAGTPAGKRR